MGRKEQSVTGDSEGADEVASCKQGPERGVGSLTGAWTLSCGLAGQSPYCCPKMRIASPAPLLPGVWNASPAQAQFLLLWKVR